jgi:arginine-tRNA-protein transferase
MESVFHYVASPSPCGYLPGRQWSLEYEHVAEMSKAEYLARMVDNWRRFGGTMFRPACATCAACQSLRVPAATFRPDRSQRRCRAVNEGAVQLRIGNPSVTRLKLDLYDRYHAFQSEFKGWPSHPAKDAESYADSFVHHPFQVEEWCYVVGRRLVGVGYVDVLDGRGGEAGRRALPVLTSAAGLSAIYFFYDPDERARSLGTWNVLCLISEAARRGLPYVYLGYHVDGSRSMEYKARFCPNEKRGEDGVWLPYRGA